MRTRLILALIPVLALSTPLAAGQPLVVVDADIETPGIQSTARIKAPTHTVSVVSLVHGELAGYCVALVVSDTGVLGAPVSLDHRVSGTDFIWRVAKMENGLTGFSNGWDPCSWDPTFPAPVELGHFTFTVLNPTRNVHLSVPIEGDYALNLGGLGDFAADEVIGATLTRQYDCSLLFEFGTVWNETVTSSALDFTRDNIINEDDLIALQEHWHRFIPDARETPTPTPTPSQTPRPPRDTPTPTPVATVTPGTPSPTPVPTIVEVEIPLPNLPSGALPLTFVRIPPGGIIMGATDEWSRPSQQPPHPIHIGYEFYMGKYEVTCAQYVAVLGENPPHYLGHDYPVTETSWDEWQVFIDKLNTFNYGTFTMPSEAEWEYACRAGSLTRFHFGDSDCPPTGNPYYCDLNAYANWDGNTGNDIKPVGLKLPNLFGLHDMHGNLEEWCLDDWHENYTAPGRTDDGAPWIDSPRNPFRVLRGGSLQSDAEECTSAFRAYAWSGGHGYATGMRLVME